MAPTAADLNNPNQKPYWFNVSNIDPRKENVTVTMGLYFTVLTPKTSISSKYRGHDEQEKYIDEVLRQIEAAESKSSQNTIQASGTKRCST